MHEQPRIYEASSFERSLQEGLPKSEHGYETSEIGDNRGGAHDVHRAVWLLSVLWQCRQAAS